VFAALLSGPFVARASAQSHPDFSGRWTSEPEAAATPATTPARGGGGGAGGGRGARGDMGSGWGSNITIAQDAQKLTVEYMFFVRGDMQPPLKFNYALDGSESKNTVMMGRGFQQQLSKTSWSGDKLVITTVHNFQNPATNQPMSTEVTHTLSLTSPTTLLVEVARAGVLGGPATTTQTTYRKLVS
jgi:hypothetical protein